MASQRPGKICRLLRVTPEDLNSLETISNDTQFRFTDPLFTSLEAETTNEVVTGETETVHVTMMTDHAEKIEDHLLYRSHLGMEIRFTPKDSISIISIKDFYLADRRGRRLELIADLKITGISELQREIAVTQSSGLLELLCKTEREQDETLERFHFLEEDND